MVVLGAGVRKNGGAEDLDVARVGAGQDLLVGSENTMHQRFVLSRRNFRIAHQRTEIVDSLEDNKVANAGLGEHVVVKAGKSIRAKAVEQEAVSADPLVENAERPRRRRGLQA